MAVFSHGKPRNGWSGKFVARPAGWRGWSLLGNLFLLLVLFSDRRAA